MAETIVKNLFLDGIFNDDTVTPSAVYITMPNQPVGTFYKNVMVGLMAGDPSWSAANTWTPVISDLSNLQDWMSLIGSQSQFSWINASTLCWKGTAPLNLSIDFYLINYSKNLKLEENLAMLTKLAAISQDPKASGMTENFMVNVHGGYAADILTGNKSYFTRKKEISKYVAGKQGSSLTDLNDDISRLYNADGDAYGAVKVTFGNKSSISNLLLSKINITESTVEVADQSGGNIKPLYYRVSAQFTGVRPLITKDVDNIFKPVNGINGSSFENPHKDVIPYIVGQGRAGG